MDFISVAEFKVCRSLVILDFSENQNVHSLTSDDDNVSIAKLITNVMYEFCSVVSNSEKYTVTQYISDYIRKHGIDGIVVIGGDGSYRGAQALSKQGINTIGLPGTIDLDIACTDYTIGFDTAINTAMEAIDKVRDTSSSHERCSIIEVMGRNAGYIALWCGVANGAEDILLPEKYDYNEQNIINNIINNRKHGKTHHIIINAEGIGHSTSMARRSEAATGIATRATILGYMQRGGNPTCKDRFYASIMGAYAADILCEGKTNRVVGHQGGKFVDFDIDEALAMQKDIDDYEYSVSRILSM